MIIRRKIFSLKENKNELKDAVVAGTIAAAVPAYIGRQGFKIAGAKLKQSPAERTVEGQSELHTLADKYNKGMKEVADKYTKNQKNIISQEIFDLGLKEELKKKGLTQENYEKEAEKIIEKYGEKVKNTSYKKFMSKGRKIVIPLSIAGGAVMGTKVYKSKVKEKNKKNDNSKK